MFKFEYEIEINDEGRPYINPVGDTDKELDFIEHKFMGLELTRAVIGGTIKSYEKNPEKYPLSEDEYNRLLIVESEINRIANLYSRTIRDQFELLGIADRLLNQNFDLTVITNSERDELNYNGIIVNDKIYKREIGLKVKVIQTGEIFELVGGIDNEHWTKIN